MPASFYSISPAELAGDGAAAAVAAVLVEVDEQVREGVQEVSVQLQPVRYSVSNLPRIIRGGTTPLSSMNCVMYLLLLGPLLLLLLLMNLLLLHRGSHANRFGTHALTATHAALATLNQGTVIDLVSTVGLVNGQNLFITRHSIERVEVNEDHFSFSSPRLQ